MLTLHRQSSDASASRHPWEAPHAAPEDRAVGLELELIELVHRRDEVSEHNHRERARLDAEIGQVVADLDRVADEVAATGTATG